MTRNLYIKASILLLFSSCATFKIQVNEQVNQSLVESNKEISHRFYLIGDVGNKKSSEPSLPILSLQRKLLKEKNKTTVLFLGNNTYRGLSHKGDKTYELSSQNLKNQINAVKAFNGNRIFIPGNQDYSEDGIKGLKRQERFVDKALDKHSFLPKNGCPITDIKVSNEVTLLIIDSQWYLENWDKNPTMNDDCHIKTRKAFFLEFESLIKKNRSKTTIVALHHPLFTDGSHGGNFSFMQHMTPMPLLGTLVNLVRKTGGVSVQDIQNKNYRFFVNRLSTIAQESERVIFTSGHENSLQYIERNNIVQIVSGSGSKVSAVKKSIESKFAYGALGYAILDIYKDGSSKVKFIQTKESADETVFTKDIFEAEKEYETTTFPSAQGSEKKASIYNLETTQKGKAYRYLWGEHYRNSYGYQVSAPIANLDTLYGGLKPIKRGGGNQSISLRLEDKEGKQWVMRALKKNAVQFLQVNMYQQKYMKGDLKGTFIESFIDDVYTTTHPYASFIMPTLSKAIGVYYTKPKLFFVPKQNALGNYNEVYGDAMYMIEEHVGESQHGQENFGNAYDIISSLDLFEKMHKNYKNQVDANAFVRARLFDMILGDWDRHQDQWRWSKFNENGKHIYRPIPRDRDQVFSNYDGALLSTITRLIPNIKKMQRYREEIRSIKWHNTNGRPVDMKLLKTLTINDWLVEAKYIKENLTDEVIEKAFSQFPIEVQNENITKAKKVLKYRRDEVEKIASAYYEILMRSVILTASNKDDDIIITRLDKGETKIQFYLKEELTFEKVYSKEETKEIWLYALDGEDQIQVKGESNEYIRIKILGGQNNDKYTLENGNGVILYDYKSKKNDISEIHKAKIRLTDDYETNTYDYYKRKDKSNQLLPSFGRNIDEGIFLGLNHTLTINNLRQNPFSKRHNTKVKYYLENDGYDLAYNGEYGNIFNKMNIQFGVRYTSPNYANNFFGFGNETKNFDDQLSSSYNRIKLAQLKTELGIVKRGNQGSKLDWLITFESNKIENTDNRILENFDESSDFFERKNFAGSEVNYQFKNYNNTAYPTLGINFQLKIGWKINTENREQNFGYVIPTVSFIHKLTKDERLVIANKTKAHINIENDFEFYQAATLGARDGLRGFRFQRFTGNNIFYNNIDLRFSLKKIKSGFAPISVGVYGGFDVGRVWLDGEESNKWHNSYGGGFWLKMAELATAQLGVFSSLEETVVSFGFGFGF